MNNICPTRNQIFSYLRHFLDAVRFFSASKRPGPSNSMVVRLMEEQGTGSSRALPPWCRCRPRSGWWVPACWALPAAGGPEDPGIPIQAIPHRYPPEPAGIFLSDTDRGAGLAEPHVRSWLFVIGIKHLPRAPRPAPVALSPIARPGLLPPGKEVAQHICRTDDDNKNGVVPISVEGCGR